MTDTTTEFVPVEPDEDLLLAETGQAEARLLGAFTDDAAADDVEEQGDVPRSLPRRAGGGWLTALADISRSAGLRTVEVPGWRGRGHGPMRGVLGFACHHTGTSARASGNYPTLVVVRDGRPGLEGPLCHYGIGRDGTVYVVAAGRAYHAGPTFATWQSNSYCIGIECEGDGGTPFTAAQMRTYTALAAAVCNHYDIPTGHVESHKMIARPHYRKTDPYGMDMAAFRSAVADARKNPAAVVADPPKPVDPTVGHRGVPRPLVEDGIFCSATDSRTLDAWMWHVPGGDRLVGFTRDNVRDVQSWAGLERTGRLDDATIKAVQGKVGAVQDGVWPREPGRRTDTTRRLQAYLNARIAEAARKAEAPAQDETGGAA